MKFKRTEDTTRVICADDPTVEVISRLGGMHAGPTVFFVGLDGEMFNFVAGRPDGPVPNIDGPLPEEFRFYTIVDMLQIRKVRTALRSKTLVDNWLRSTATSFASAEQQDRVIEALTDGIKELGTVYDFMFSRVTFSKALQQKLKDGDFVEQ